MFRIPWLILPLILALATVAISQGDHVYQINGGESFQVQFTLRRPAAISGRFESRDGRSDLATAATAVAATYARIPNTIQNNVEVLIVDERNYSARTAGGSFASFYNSGRETSGQFKVNLPAGSYRFVISNSHSLLASKTVRLSLDADTQAIFNAGDTPAPLENPIARFLDNRFVLPAGSRGSIAWPLTLNGPARVLGKFTTAGGNNDINFVILDAANMARWNAGLYFSAIVQTGYVSGEQIVDYNLPAGKFYLVFDNRKALLTQKTVIAAIGVSALTVR